MSAARRLPLDGVHNFRDFGGYARVGGGRVARGLLWRSGQHGAASDADLAAIAAINLAHVADLRGDSERANWPCRRPDGFAAHVLFAPGETSGGHANAVGAAGGSYGEVRSAGDAACVMRFIYASMPDRPVLLATLRLYLDALAKGGPALVHCFAGKDRTGFAVALVQTLLGVHRDDILADYMLTMEGEAFERHVAAKADDIRAGFGAAMDDGAVRVLLGVAPDFLDTALAAVAQSHGTVERFAAQQLGWTAAKQDALVAAYAV